MAAMNTQLPLFPPANRTPTSRAAAESIAGCAPNLRERVYRHIRSMAQQGATIDEVSASLGMLTATVCGRANELKRAGRIKDSGRTRVTRSGRHAAVLIAEGGGE